MSAIFGRKLFGQALNIGRKISGGFQGFGQKINNFSTKVNNGISKFDNTAGKVANTLEKISREDASGVAKTALAGVNLTRSAAHLFGDATKVGSSLATGNLQQALNQGKGLVNDGKSFLGSAGTFGGQAATTAAGAMAFL